MFTGVAAALVERTTTFYDDRPLNMLSGLLVATPRTIVRLIMKEMAPMNWVVSWPS
jgi:hypothetical protein